MEQLPDDYEKTSLGVARDEPSTLGLPPGPHRGHRARNLLYWISGVTTAVVLIGLGFFFGSAQHVIFFGGGATVASTTSSGMDQRLAGTMMSMDELRSLSVVWNGNQLEWGLALQDPDLSLEEFTHVSNETLQSQAAVVSGIRLAVRKLPSSQLEAAFQPIVDHYQARFDALIPLIAASISGPEGEFQRSLAAYLEVVDPAAVARVLRSVFEDDSVMELILHDAAEKGVDGDPREILDAFLDTFAAPSTNVLTEFSAATRSVPTTTTQQIGYQAVNENRRKEEEYFRRLGLLFLSNAWEEPPVTEEAKAAAKLHTSLLSVGYLLASSEFVGEARDVLIDSLAASGGTEFAKRLIDAAVVLDGDLAEGALFLCFENDPSTYLEYSSSLNAQEQIDFCVIKRVRDNEVDMFLRPTW